MATPIDIKHWLKQWPQILTQFDRLILKLKLKQITGSYPCATTTLELVRSVLGTCRFHHAEHMITVVRSIGKELSFVAPSEFTIGNMIRRILFVIRDEYATKIREISSTPAGAISSKSTAGGGGGAGGSQQWSNDNFENRDRSGSQVSKSSEPAVEEEVIVTRERQFDEEGSDEEDEDHSHAITSRTKKFHPRVGRDSHDGGSPNIHSFYEHSLQPSLGSVLGHTSFNDAPLESNLSTPRTEQVTTTGLTNPVDIRQGIMSTIQEITLEMENSITSIASVAADFIHSGECVLVLGQSSTIQHFLASAAKKMKFQVIIAAEGQAMTGHRMATYLSNSNNISVSLVPENAVYALMSKVHKVLFSPQALMADGGVICFAGHLMTILAAKERSIPVVGISGMHKLTPLYSHNQMNVLQTMSSPSEVLPDDASVNIQQIEVLVPSYDYIPPELIQIYITNNGSHQPSYIYRLLSEFFHPLDTNY